MQRVPNLDFAWDKSSRKSSMCVREIKTLCLESGQSEYMYCVDFCITLNENTTE